jgi:hypothetical protein
MLAMIIILGIILLNIFLAVLGAYVNSDYYTSYPEKEHEHYHEWSSL